MLQFYWQSLHLGKFRTNFISLKYWIEKENPSENLSAFVLKIMENKGKRKGEKKDKNNKKNRIKNWKVGRYHKEEQK